MTDSKFPKSSKYKWQKNLAKRYRLVPHLDKFFSKEVVGLQFTLEGKPSDFAWHPSGDCTPAPSALYDMALDRRAGRVEKSFSKAFPIGHFWHQLCQYAVLQMDLAKPDAIERRGTRAWGSASVGTVRVEDGDTVPWLPFHYCTGSADIAPLCLPDHPPYVVDFKTMMNLDYGNSNTPLPDRFAKKYEAQINVYMDFFDIDEAIIVAIQKDSPHEMKEFHYFRNDELVSAIYDKWEFVSECLTAEERPSKMDDDHFILTDLFEGPSDAA
jgi:hypothetical protein